MRISDWSSDVCSSDLHRQRRDDESGPCHGAVVPRRRSAVGWIAGGRFAGSGGHAGLTKGRRARTPPPGAASPSPGDRKSVVEGKSVSVREELGGRRNI